MITVLHHFNIVYSLYFIKKIQRCYYSCLNIREGTEFSRFVDKAFLLCTYRFESEMYLFHFRT